MRKFFMGLVVAALFSAGVGFGLGTSDASRRCWAYCQGDQGVMCCEGVGCWITGPCWD